MLIQAAGGVISTMAVQIAKAFGNTVYGTARSDKKLELLSKLGINIGINYIYKKIFLKLLNPKLIMGWMLF